MKKSLIILVLFVFILSFGLLPKIAIRKYTANDPHLKSSHMASETIKVLLVGYHRNLDTEKSSLKVGDIKVTPDFETKALSGPIIADGILYYVLSVKGASSNDELTVELPGRETENEYEFDF